MLKLCIAELSGQVLASFAKCSYQQVH